jgi:hypothetical protein
MCRHVRVGSGNRDFFAEGLVHRHLVLTGRDNPVSAATTAIRKKRMV